MSLNYFNYLNKGYKHLLGLKYPTIIGKVTVEVRNIVSGRDMTSSVAFSSADRQKKEATDSWTDRLRAGRGNRWPVHVSPSSPELLQGHHSSSSDVLVTSLFLWGPKTVSAHNVRSQVCRIDVWMHEKDLTCVQTCSECAVCELKSIYKCVDVWVCCSHCSSSDRGHLLLCNSNRTSLQNTFPRVIAMDSFVSVLQPNINYRERNYRGLLIHLIRTNARWRFCFPFKRTFPSIIITVMKYHI